MLGFVMTGFLGPKGKSGFTGRMSFLCYSPTTVRGLEWTPHFKTICWQSWSLWTTSMMMIPSVTGGQDQCLILHLFPSSSYVPFIVHPLLYRVSVTFFLICLSISSSQKSLQISPGLFLPCSGRINNFLHLVTHIWCSFQEQWCMCGVTK